MKRLIIIIAVLLIGLSGYSQMQMGYYIKTLKHKMDSLNIEYHMSRIDNGDRVMAIELNDYNIYYYFNEHGISYINIITPFKRGWLQSKIEELNNQWVIIDNRHWVLYGQIIIHCKYVTTDGNIYLVYSFN